MCGRGWVPARPPPPSLGIADTGTLWGDREAPHPSALMFPGARARGQGSAGRAQWARAGPGPREPRRGLQRVCAIQNLLLLPCLGVAKPRQPVVLPERLQPWLSFTQTTSRVGCCTALPWPHCTSPSREGLLLETKQTPDTSKQVRSLPLQAAPRHGRPLSLRTSSLHYRDAITHHGMQMCS